MAKVTKDVDYELTPTGRKPWSERRKAVRPSVQKALDTDDIDALVLALPIMQRLFAVEYVKDFNGSAACLRAGSKTVHPEKVAYMWLANPGVRRYVDHLMDERTKNTRIDQGYVLDKLVKALERNEKSNQQANLRAIELLMKHLGMLTEKTEITGRDGGAIQYEKMNEDADAFTRAIAGIAKRAGPGEGTDETSH